MKIVVLIDLFLLQSSSEEAQEGLALRAGRGVLQNRTQASGGLCPPLSADKASSQQGGEEPRGRLLTEPDLGSQRMAE